MDIDVTVLFFNIAVISKHTLPESVRYQHDMVTHRDSYLMYEFLPNKPSYSTEEIFKGIHNIAARETQAVKSGFVSVF